MKEFKYVTIIRKPSWAGYIFHVDEKNVILDNKQIDFEANKLFGTYYFLDHEMVVITEQIQTIITILSSFAGVALSIYHFSMRIGRFVNDKTIIAKLVRAMYYVQRKSN